jgi:hypothetical protein
VDGAVIQPGLDGRVDQAVLLDAGEPGELGRDHDRAEVVSPAVVLDLGRRSGERGLDHLPELVQVRHRHAGYRRPGS